MLALTSRRVCQSTGRNAFEPRTALPWKEKWKFDSSICHNLTLRILKDEVFSGVVDTGLMVWVES